MVASLYTTTRLEDLKKPKSVPSWLKNPDEPGAIDKCEKYILELLLTDGEGDVQIPFSEYADQLDAVQKKIINKASVRAIEHLRKVEGLTKRVRERLQLRVWQVGASYDDDELSFKEMLTKRLGQVTSAGAISETEFMLDVLNTLETWGYGEWVDAVFTSDIAFSKFGRTISVLRIKYKSTDAARKIIQEQIEKGKLTGEKKEEAEKAIAEKDEEFLSAISEAVKLTNDPRVEVHGDHGIKATLLQNLHMEDKKKKKDKPQPEKPLLLTAEMGTSVIFYFSIHRNYRGNIERLLQDTLEPTTSDINEMIEILQSYKKEA